MRNRAAGFLLSLAVTAAWGQGLAERKRDPYLGAIVVEARTGAVLFEDRADEPGYPASMLKLMDLLLVLEKVQAGALRLEDPVTVTREAAQIGGSQVYLAEKEIFTVEELLYALMIQSANDAATALAIHVGGSKDGFVRLMNEKARALGMTKTVFQSVHGLPPATGQTPDVSTARDFARLGCELVNRFPEALRFTSTRERTFRQQPLFIMRTHNNLLGSFPGCDGLKTGYFRAGGYSMSATAERNGVRLVGVILGSPDKTTRDNRMRELLSAAFLNAPPPPPPPPPVVVAPPTNFPPAENAPAMPAPPASGGRRGWLRWTGAGLIVLAFLGILRRALARR